MRFSYIDAMIDPSFLKPLAVAAEEAGYDGFVVPDSICYPQESDSKYPYTADGSREFLEDKPFIEPFSLIPYLAGATTALRFVTFVVKLPLRHPILIAKQASSVAVLSENRFAFGVGLSPWPDDFEILQLPWARRGKRMDECIEVVRGLCTGDWFGYEGEIFSFDPIKICPAPTQPVPILVGGHSRPALRRAVLRGDGWMHAGGAPDELARILDEIVELRREHGKQNESFEVHAISTEGYTPDGVKRLEDASVTDLVIGFRNSYTPGPDTQTLDEKLALLWRFADTVMARCR